MTDQKILLKILGKMDHIESDMSEVKTDISVLKTDVSGLKEESSITCTAVNKLLDWADDASIQIVPLFKKAK